MKISAVLLMLCFLPGCVSQSFAQCPPSDTLYGTIVSVANDIGSNNSEKLQQLLSWEHLLIKCPRKDSAYTYLLRRIGVCYSNNGDYKKGIEYTNSAINSIQAQQGKSYIDLMQLPICYYNLQSYYDSVGQTLQRQNALDSCIAIDIRLGGNYAYSSTLFGEKAANLCNEGDYIGCVKFASLAERLLNNSDTIQQQAKCMVLSNHTNALILLNRFADAEQLLLREKNSFTVPAARRYVGSYYNLLATIRYYRGDYDNALANFLLAAKYDKNYPVGLAESLNWIGFLYGMRLNQPQRGLSYYKKALSFADNMDAIQMLSSIGRIYAQMNMFDSSFHFFQAAFDLIQPGSNERTLVEKMMREKSSNRIMNYFTGLLSYKGDAYLKKYMVTRNPETISRAIEVYIYADKLLSNVQAATMDMGSKLFWRNNATSLYENAIESSYLSGNIKSAFYFFEKSRASLLHQQLNEQRWIKEQDIAAQSQLKSAIHINEENLNRLDKSSPAYTELQKVNFAYVQQLEALQEKIKSNNPGYYQKFIDTSSIQLADAQQVLLKKNATLIELFSGDSAVYLLFISPTSSSLKKIDKTAFDSFTTKYTTFLSNSELLEGRYNEFLATSHQLFNLLFEGLRGLNGRVIFSPDGKYFPIESLVTTLPKKYFIESYPVSYAYSFRYLMQAGSNQRKENQNLFLGLAPIDFPSAFGLPALKGSEKSLSRITQHFNEVRNLIGSEASKRNFLNDFYNYDIIQVYAHATDSSSGGEPVIFFADSVLLLSDLIYAHKPFTKLIVLSACKTASGKLYNGEGVFNFNRGFAALGIPSSISNLWSVETDATYKITELFYSNLAKGAPADIALQQAKLSFMNDNSVARNQLPSLWAASILVGSAEEFHERSFSFLNAAIILISLLILAVLRFTSRPAK